MSVNSINHILRRLKISRGGISALYTTSCAPQSSPPPPPGINPFIFTQNLRFSPSNPHLTLDLPFHNNFIYQKIIEIPKNSQSPIINPQSIKITPMTDKIPENQIDLPTKSIIEKQAARLIVIRRRKMRRHKLRKLRKRMKFVWRKKKQRRELKKEKAFQAELIGQIHQAEMFDAKTYVESRLKILDNVRLPSKWRGEVLPESMIKEFLKDKEERRLKKINRPRISLE